MARKGPLTSVTGGEKANSWLIIVFLILQSQVLACSLLLSNEMNFFIITNKCALRGETLMLAPVLPLGEERVTIDTSPASYLNEATRCVMPMLPLRVCCS